MSKMQMSAAHTLGQFRVDVLPLLVEMEPALVKMGDLHHWPEAENLLRLVRILIPRLRSFQPARERSFWNRVDHRGTHMIWLGEGRNGPEGAPVCEWEGKRTTAARVAWSLLTGEKLASGREGERLRRICDQPRCISPTCHRKASSQPGRVTGIHMDKDGKPVCKQGHPLKRFPRPRETVYCSVCYQMRKAKDRFDGPVDLSVVPARHPVDPHITPEGLPLVVPLRLTEAEDRSIDTEQKQATLDKLRLAQEAELADIASLFTPAER